MWQPSPLDHRKPTNAPEQLAGVRVLLVDDERDSRAILQTLLATAGAIVTAVESASSALKALSSDAFDVFVFDIRLPDQTGYELLAQVRQGFGERGMVPALAVSGYDCAEYREGITGAGFSAYLLKPVESRRLVQTLERIVRVVDR